jgi:hypothetical protein
VSDLPSATSCSLCFIFLCFSATSFCECPGGPFKYMVLLQDEQNHVKTDIIRCSKWERAWVAWSGILTTPAHLIPSLFCLPWNFQAVLPDLALFGVP